MPHHKLPAWKKTALELERKKAARELFEQRVTKIRGLGLTLYGQTFDECAQGSTYKQQRKLAVKFLRANGVNLSTFKPSKRNNNKNKKSEETPSHIICPKCGCRLKTKNRGRHMRRAHGSKKKKKKKYHIWDGRESVSVHTWRGGLPSLGRRKR